jgi:hypothetical protein
MQYPLFIVPLVVHNGRGVVSILQTWLTVS